MTLKEKKRILYDGLKDLQRDFDFSKPFKAKFSLKVEGYELVFEDSTRLVLDVHRASKHHNAGEFAANSGFAVFGGSLYALILDRLPDAKRRYPHDKLIVGTSSGLVPGRLHDYEFSSNIDVEALTREVLEDIRTYLLPLAKAFVEDYARAAEGMMDGSIIGRTAVRNPFVLTLALLQTTKSLHLVDQLVAVASRNERFYDFHEAGRDGWPRMEDLVHAFSS